jgi:isopentenyldiphosphate isomerase
VAELPRYFCRRAHRLRRKPTYRPLREAQEEIGLTIETSSLQQFSVERAQLVAETGDIENEFRWLYLLELPSDHQFTLQESEVESLVWKTLEDFETECGGDTYVPHGKDYYAKVVLPSALRTRQRKTEEGLHRTGAHTSIDSKSENLYH